MSTHTPAMNKVQIVVAYTDMTGLKNTGRMIQKDLNWFSEFVAVEAPKAAMWLRCGTQDDVSEAEAHMAREHSDTRWAVYTFEKGHRDPLGEAKARIMHAAKGEAV